MIRSVIHQLPVYLQNHSAAPILLGRSCLNSFIKNNKNLKKNKSVLVKLFPTLRTRTLYLLNVFVIGFNVCFSNFDILRWCKACKDCVFAHTKPSLNRCATTHLVISVVVDSSNCVSPVRRNELISHMFYALIIELLWNVMKTYLLYVIFILAIQSRPLRGLFH